jgi:hypothetical protein
MSARRNHSDEALTQIAKAAEYAPDELFVQRTAGELLAWLDTRADQSKVSSEARKAADDVRQRMRDKRGSRDAYDDAREQYANQSDVAGSASAAPLMGTQMYSQPFSAPTQEYAHPDPGVVQAPPAIVYNNYYYNSYPAYTDPYAYASYPYYGSYWPGSYLYISNNSYRHGYSGFNNFHVSRRNVGNFSRFSNFDRFSRSNAFVGGFQGLNTFNAIRFAPTRTNFGVGTLPSRFGGTGMRFAPMGRMGFSPMGGMRTMPMRSMGRMR